MANGNPLGQVVKVESMGDGTSNVYLDNGATNLMIIHTLDTALDALLSEDSQEIHRMIAKPLPGARNKITERRKRS